MNQRNVIVVRGGGDLASGVIHRLYRSGYRILVLESKRPSAIRREVSFCDAVYDETSVVEGVVCRRIAKVQECRDVWEAGEIPLLTDEDGSAVSVLKPAAVVDAILAKRNLGTSREMAPLTIALGPGFEAGKDVDFVVETKRGHDLGRIIEEGYAFANTGVPGMVGGVSKERVIHSPAAGMIRNLAQISDSVEKGQILAVVGETPVKATITGVLRGIIREGYEVFEGMKIADIDPRREETKNCYTISDKARCIAGSVLEILLAKGVLP
jgi:xanthine dehydrogenase accessory factor